jgi:hypothetical protein
MMNIGQLLGRNDSTSMDRASIHLNNFSLLPFRTPNSILSRILVRSALPRRQRCPASSLVIIGLAGAVRQAASTPRSAPRRSWSRSSWPSCARQTRRSHRFQQDLIDARFHEARQEYSQELRRIGGSKMKSQVSLAVEALESPPVIDRPRRLAAQSAGTSSPAGAA